MTEPEPPRAPVDLRRPRDLGSLLADGFRVYVREFRAFVLIGLAVVVPVQLIVGGIGLGQLSAEYDRTPSTAETLIPLITSVLVLAPLVTAMSVYALLDVAEGRRPVAGRAIQRGLDVFAPLLVVVLLYAAGVALGLLLLIIPGVYLAIRWLFYIQTAVIDEQRGTRALERSTELVEGSWWRVFGVFLVANFLTSGLSALVGVPFLAAADATGRAVYQLAGQTVGGVLAAPALALIVTLLYFDQRVRKGR